MAVLKGAAGPALIVNRDDEAREIKAWYRDLLDRTAPPEGLRWEPVKIGPTWQHDGQGWVLPEATIGWDFLAWTGMWLRHRGKPWCYTPEQARFLLHFFAVGEDLQFLHHSAVLQRLKGWGKDPIAASLAAGYMVGPVVPYAWDGDRPLATDEPDAWVQIAAVNQDQSKNTMKLFPGLIPMETRERYGIQIGKLNVWALGDTRQIEAVTKSPMAIEGGRPKLVVRAETQNWLAGNFGHDMAGAMEGNAAKAELGAPARMLDICNAYRPGEDSVGERVRTAWEATQGDRDADDDGERPKAMAFGLLYDSLEAPPQAPLKAEAAPEVVEAVRGDSVWLDARGRILKSILNPANAPSESRRKWYNQVTAAEDAWTTPQAWDAIGDDSKALEPREEIVMFLDASKSDDATGLVACRVSDGHVVTLGMWQRPPLARGEAAKAWTVPRDRVDAAVKEARDRYTVVGFFVDPSHSLDDETANRYWDGLCDKWHREMRGHLRVWAKPGQSGHSVMFDMSLYENQKKFVDALAVVETEIEDEAFTHDGDLRLRNHVINARRRPTKAGLSIAKDPSNPRKKIDLAVCMIGARMVRRTYLNSRKKKGGWAW